MQIKGDRLIKGSQQDVWDILQDADALKHSLPGISEFNQVGESEWRGTIAMGVGPVKGSYSGKIIMFDQQEPSRYKLAMEGEGGAGWVKAEGTFELEALNEETTRVVYNIEAQVGGLVASVGQRMLSGVGKMVLGQFFKSMENQLRSRKAMTDAS